LGMIKRLIGIPAVALLVGLAVYHGVNGNVSDDTVLKWDRAGIMLGYMLACITVGGFVVAWFSRDTIELWLRRHLFRRRFEGLGEEFEVDEETVDGLVVPVSNPQQPEWLIRHLRPKSVAFIYTERSRPLLPKLHTVAGEFGARILNDLKDGDPGFVQDHARAEQTKAAAARIIRTMKQEGLAPAHLFVDTTGGSVPMSIGLFQAAEEAGISTIYVRGTRTVKGRPDQIEDPAQRSHGHPIFISDHTEDGA